MLKRPSILKQDDLKELDELDHDGDEGWAGKTANKASMDIHFCINAYKIIIIIIHGSHLQVICSWDWQGKAFFELFLVISKVLKQQISVTEAL